jgi:hypothetical protein
MTIPFIPHPEKSTAFIHRFNTFHFYDPPEEYARSGV